MCGVRFTIGRELREVLYERGWRAEKMETEKMEDEEDEKDASQPMGC